MEHQWLTFREAARRTRRDLNSIRRWKRDGMPSRMVDGRNEVELEVLLGWMRDRVKASPVEHYRRRRRAREMGLPDPVVPSAAPKPVPAPVTPDEPDEPPAPPKPYDPLDNMKPMSGRTEYATLLRAMRDQPPPCDRVQAFTADHISAEQQKVLESLCAACPLADLCRAYVDVARPPAGFWAGMSAAEISRLPKPAGSCHSVTAASVSAVCQLIS